MSTTTPGHHLFLGRLSSNIHNVLKYTSTTGDGDTEIQESKPASSTFKSHILTCARDSLMSPVSVIIFRTMFTLTETSTRSKHAKDKLNVDRSSNQLT